MMRITSQKLLMREYGVGLSEEVQTFLYHHPGVAGVVAEAYPYLLGEFGQDVQIRMQVVLEPEVDYMEQLVAYIVTDLSVDQALASLDQFDQRWYLDQLDRLDGNLCFNLDFV